MELMQNVGTPILSIQWGAWGEDFDGMTSGDRRVLTKMRHHGFGVLKPEEGVLALDHFNTPRVAGPSNAIR